DEKMVDEKMVDEKMVDEKMVDEKMVDEKMVDEKVVDEKMVDEKMVDEKMVDEKIPLDSKNPKNNNLPKQSIDSINSNTNNPIVQPTGVQPIGGTNNPIIQPAGNTENDFYSMLSHFSDLKFFSSILYNHLFCFKISHSELQLLKIKKDKKSFEDFLDNKNLEIVNNFEDSNFFYFLKDNLEVEDMVLGVISAGQSFLGENLDYLEILQLFPNRRILRKVNQQIVDLFFSIVSLVFLKSHVYCSEQNIKLHVDPNILFLMLNTASLGFFCDRKLLQYILKDLSLPKFKKNLVYYKLKKHVVDDKFLSILNNMSISFEGAVEDFPFNIIEHILNVFFIIAFKK
ncbi:Dynein heavy chain-like protein, partial [Nosema granulosis]